MNAKIAMYFASIFVCCILLNSYIWFVYKDIALLNAITIFCTLITSLSILFIYVLKKHMGHIFNQLSQVISSMIDMREIEVFSILNDDMLSKLQSQIIKLTNILKAQNTRIKRDRDEIKSLISDISHQLKTPLSNLKLYYELMQYPSISKGEYTEFSMNIQSQIEKLSFLLESMIKMSRLEGGIIQLIQNKANLNDVCLTVIKQAYEKARNKNIEIQFDSGEDIILNIDKNWTAEAIFNIIDNAVKYTSNNSTIIVNTMKYEIFARVDITDNGIGIDEKEINNVFKRFYRGEHTQGEDGVGLGLYLAREIITKQNGYIKVKSQMSQGSVFSLFLPLN
ncbi:sensor histidine kinase [Marinisporobacter balticus]